MQVFFGLNTFPKHYASSVATIGVFDGLHRAHMEIIRNVVQRAKELNTHPILINFEPHPKVIKGEMESIGGILTSPKEKMKILKNSGLEAILFLNTDRELLDIAPEDFVKTILVGHIRVKELIVGFDYSFGKDRSGDIYDLKKFGKKFGFNVNIINPIKDSNFMIKSSRIREHLLKGNIKEANRLLGRYYGITGFVVRGEGRGRELGYPTANLRLTYKHKLVPKSGTYLTLSHFKGFYRYGLCNIGYRPTFEGTELSIEVYIFEPIEGELYGTEMEVFFIERMRDEKKFSSVEELKKQIEKDRMEGLKLIESIKEEREVELDVIN